MPHKMYVEVVDVGVEEKIILKWIFNKLDEGVECIILPHHMDK